MAADSVAADITEFLPPWPNELCYYWLVMTLSVPVPDNLDEGLLEDLNNAVREFVAVRLYREGRLSHGQFAKFLGVGRGQVDEILGRYGVSDITQEELDREFESIGRMGA